MNLKKALYVTTFFMGVYLNAQDDGDMRTGIEQPKHFIGSGCERGQRTMVPVYNATEFPVHIMIIPYSCRGILGMLQAGETKDFDLGFCGLRAIRVRLQDEAIVDMPSFDRATTLEGKIDIDMNDVTNKCGNTGPWEIVATTQHGYETIGLEIRKKEEEKK